MENEYRYRLGIWEEPEPYQELNEELPILTAICDYCFKEFDEQKLVEEDSGKLICPNCLYK